MSETVADLVATLEAEALRIPTPGRASEMLLTATALMGGCVEDMTVAELAYNEVLLEAMRTEDAATRAKIRASTTPQYRDWQLAKGYAKRLEHLSMSLKAYMRMATAEIGLTR